jgi:FkbM family methyltransferase
VRDPIKDVDLATIPDHSQQKEQRIIGRYLQGMQTPYSPFFVDVGAYDGVTGSNSRFLAELGWGGIVIEPTPQAYAQLESLYAENPAVRSIRCAISDYTSDEAEMLVAEGPEGVPEDIRWHYSQVSTLNPWFAKGFVEEHGYRYRSVLVPVRPLADVLAANDCPPDLGALFIDCEGEDLRIIRGFDFSRFRPRLICVESEDHNRATFAEALLPHGYVEYDHTWCNTFFRLQGDR